jgi:hypothetical protein
MTDEVDSDDGSPGSHGRNWLPASTDADYLCNCREGLEERSDRRMAKLMGWSRAHMWRVKLMAELPDDLFEALLAAGGCSSKSLAAVALALRRGEARGNAECCPRCGHVLRIRGAVSDAHLAIVNRWLSAKDL